MIDYNLEEDDPALKWFRNKDAKFFIWPTKFLLHESDYWFNNYYRQGYTHVILHYHKPPRSNRFSNTAIEREVLKFTGMYGKDKSQLLMRFTIERPDDDVYELVYKKGDLNAWRWTFPFKDGYGDKFISQQFVVNLNDVYFKKVN